MTMQLQQRPPRTRRRLLLVEDEDLIRDLLEEGFSEQGFEVITARSGDLAAHSLKDGDFDILVTDVNMPGHLSGLDLVWRARAFSYRLPTVIITGRPDLVTGKLTTSEILVRKPFAFAHLMNAVDNLLH